MYKMLKYLDYYGKFFRFDHSFLFLFFLWIIKIEPESFNHETNKYDLKKMIYYSYAKEFLRDYECEKCKSK